MLEIIVIDDQLINLKITCFIIFSIVDDIIFLSIFYHMRLGVVEAKVDNIIQFSNSYYPCLEYKGHLENSYNFLKKYFTILRIL